LPRCLPPPGLEWASLRESVPSPTAVWGVVGLIGARAVGARCDVAAKSHERRRHRAEASPSRDGASKRRAITAGAPVLLRPREKDLVRLVSLAASNKEIARLLGLAVTSVETYLSRLYQRVGVRNRVELAVRSQQERWLEDA
jgi:DNA-binding NarL/FixJ family response regulator